ncbi:hypothetical protein ACEPAH_4718 [Sanghuangporus vaninii]
MHTGHAQLSFKPPSVAASPPSLVPPLEPLSPLSDPSPSPPLLGDAQTVLTRSTSGSTGRQSQRRRDAAEHTASSAVIASSVRRIRPLACMTSSTNANTQNTGKEKAAKTDAWKVGVTQQEQQEAIDFPPKHVVLHPDDVNNKVFLSMGRALMSVNNRAMTIKDLADLSLQHGLICQNVSAASQAITFFIRSHLNRCEEQNDFPLLLRHVLSGTSKDDALAPALYSRTGGNVSHKDKMARDENGNLKERVTCFRRGTTVWYLSKAAGAPCPFARVGIALRDYAECSSITSVEGRKGDNDFSRGLKRKRELNLRRRAGSGPAARRLEDDSDSDERRRPPKIKLTLRLRPNPAGGREKVESAPERSSSSSDSDSGMEDERMDVDNSTRSSAPPPSESTADEDDVCSFPPYPISRRIDIPPYTPSEYVYPTFYRSPTTNYSTSAFFSEWTAVAKPMACVDPPPQSSSRYRQERAASVPFSVASPPPDSDDEFGLDDDDDDDVSLSMSPEVKLKREDELSYVWPQAAPSTSSLDLANVKSEPFDDLDLFEAASSKRSSTHTVKQEDCDDFSLDLASLSLTFGEPEGRESDPFGLGGIREDDGLFGFGDGLSWGQPVDLTHDEPVQSTREDMLRAQAAIDTGSWRHVELLGPETIDLQELEESNWGEEHSSQGGVSLSSSKDSQSASHQEEDDAKQLPTPARSRASTIDSLSPPPSLASSVHTWSVSSPDTELDSVGPASPLLCTGPESPIIIRNDGTESILRAGDCGIERSFPWMIPGKAVSSSVPSRQSAALRLDDVPVPVIPLSEQSAPWERGMYTEEDVEKHLLEPPRPLAMMALTLPSFTDMAAEELVPEPPLSPQEEAVFQSLCICPDVSSEDEQQTDKAKQESIEVSEQVEGHMPDMTLASVFVAATRPTMRLRERRPNRRSSELGRARNHAEMCSADARKVVGDTGVDNDAEHATVASASQRKREKSDIPVHDNDDTRTNRATLRRSKRVANATAMQRNRERLRKRTVP